MPNYAQAAIQIRQKKEREAKEKEIRSQKDHRPARDNEKVSKRVFCRENNNLTFQLIKEDDKTQSYPGHIIDISLYHYIIILEPASMVKYCQAKPSQAPAPAQLASFS